MADAVGQAEVGKEGEGPAGMTCLVYSIHSALSTIAVARRYYEYKAYANRKDHII